MTLARTSLALSLGLLTAAGSVQAHHSFAQFDMQRTIRLAGTVRGVEWTNPHVWLWMEAPDEQGKPALYALEAASPLNLEQSGWNKHSVDVGMKITANMHPLRDGRKGGSVQGVTLADGTVVGNVGGPRPGGPGGGPGGGPASR